MQEIATNQNFLVWDMETTGTDVKRDKFRCGGINFNGSIFYHNRIESFTDELARLITESRYIGGHNTISFDFPFLFNQSPHKQNLIEALEYKFGLEDNATLLVVDSMVLNKIFNNSEQGNSLQEIAQEQGLGSKVHIDDWKNATDKQLEERVIRDVELSMEVCEKLLPCAMDDPVFPYLNRYTQLVLQMTWHGLPVHEDRLEKESTRLGISIFNQIRNIRKKYGVRFNPNSSAQCAEFAESLGHKLPTTESGRPSMSAKKKDSIIARIPQFEDVFKVREDMSLKSKVFGDKPSSLKANLRYGRVYPVYKPYHQIGLRTSIIEPAIGTIPKECRAINFDENYSWAGADIKALEVNVLAKMIMDLTGETELYNEVTTTSDFKANTAACLGDLMDNIEEDKKLDIAKRVFFAKVYGSYPNGLADLLKVDRSYGNEIDRLLFERAPGLEELTKEVKAEWEETGIVYCYYGYPLKPRSAHASLNAVIQSSGAIYSAILFGALDRALRASLYDFVPVIHCHDEVQYIYFKSVPERKAKLEFQRAVDQTYSYLSLNDIFMFSKLSVDWGKSWKESH